MAPPIIIEEIKDSSTTELVRLDGTEGVVVGREPQFGIKIPGATAVSREHGIFFPFNQHWLYKDLGSTNGSFLNGTAVLPDAPIILRVGEVVELAGHFLRIRLDESVSAPAVTPSSTLLVFLRGEPKTEIDTTPAIGPQDSPILLSIGGKRSSYKLEIDLEEHPSLVVEKRGQVVVAYSVAKSGNPMLNGATMAAPMTLKDRDILTVGLYRCIFSDELYRSLGATTKVAPWDEDLIQQRRATAGFKGVRSFGTLPDDKGSPKTEAFVARRIVAGNEPPPSTNPLTTVVILVLLFIFCGGLGLLVAYLL